MKRWWYMALLLICLLTLTLQVVGATTSPQDADTGGPLGWSVASILGAVTALVGWVTGIVLAAINRQWVWLALIVIFSTLAAGIYALTRLLRGPLKQEEVFQD